LLKAKQYIQNIFLPPKNNAIKASAVGKVIGKIEKKQIKKFI
jgi:hypothetical protein